MDQHLNDLKAVLAQAIKDVQTSPGFIPQARTIGYLAGRMLYGCGLEGRYKDATPFFTLQGQVQSLSATPLRAVAAQKKSTSSRTSVKPKKGGNDSGNDFLPA